MNGLTRDGTVEPVSQDQILGRERGQRNIQFLPCSADYKQDWQPCAVDPYSLAERANDTYIFKNVVVAMRTQVGSWIYQVVVGPHEDFVAISDPWSG